MWVVVLICVGGHDNVCGWACLFVWLGMFICVAGHVYLYGWACLFVWLGMLVCVGGHCCILCRNWHQETFLVPVLLPGDKSTNWREENKGKQQWQQRQQNHVCSACFIETQSRARIYFGLSLKGAEPTYRAKLRKASHKRRMSVNNETATTTATAPKCRCYI